MENPDNWLFPETPTLSVLRIRPMALSLFEGHGMNPWNPKYPCIGPLCASIGLALPAFAAELKALSEPGEDADWKNRPVFHFLDYLTREHSLFTGGLLPAIRSELIREHVGGGESLRRLRYLTSEWPAFSAALTDHIDEEESFLFPKILHYEHCLRKRYGHPDFTTGTVDVYVALRMLGNEKAQMAGINRFLNEVLFSRAAKDEPGSLESRMEPLLEELQARLLAHSALEMNVLFPMAKELEKSLMDTCIAGGKPFRDESPWIGTTP